jgi:hypothetical protein
MDTGATLDCASRYVVRPAPETSFFMVGEQKAVFCQPRQKIYALNDTAAFIWCHIEEGHAVDAICGALVGAGTSPDAAAEYVRGAIQDWLRLGLLKPRYASGAHTQPVYSTINLRAGSYGVSLRMASERLAVLLLPVFAHLRAPDDVRDEVLSVVEIDGLVHVLHGDTNLFCCAIDEVAPFIHGYVVDRTLAQRSPDLALHSACLVHGEKNLLIGGHSGAGKTTLTLRLLDAGFQYGGDDVAIVSPDGVRGLPFAPAVKPGAWRLIKRFHPKLNSYEIHRRQDGKRVRYVEPSPVAIEETRPVGWVVFLRRGTEGTATLTPIEPMDVVTRLVGEAISPSRTLTSTVLDSIKRIAVSAAGFELAYSSLDEASETLLRLCHD